MLFYPPNPLSHVQSNTRLNSKVLHIIFVPPLSQCLAWCLTNVFTQRCQHRITRQTHSGVSQMSAFQHFHLHPAIPPGWGNSSAHPAGDVEGGEWSRCCCPGEGGGCRMRPVLSQGRIFLWQMGSGLQHSLFDCHLSLAVSQSPVPPGPGAIWGGLDV